MTTEILDAAIAVARRVGYRNVTRKLLADELAPLPKFGGESQVAHNWLVNTGKMHEVIDHLVTNKDRLALVPGIRQPSANANYWKPYDRADLLGHAYRIATNEGLFALSIRKVVRASGFSAGTIHNYFTDLEGLRDEVVKEAVKHENLRVIAQGLVRDRPQGPTIPDHLRQAASKSLA